MAIIKFQKQYTLMQKHTASCDNIFPFSSGITTITVALSEGLTRYFGTHVPSHLCL